MIEIKVFEVMVPYDEMGNARSIGAFSCEEDARHLAEEADGAWGAAGRVAVRTMRVFESRADYEAFWVAEHRASALKKLTKDELAALGLKP